MIGQTISHYKILEKLGEGGMGVVYKATDTKLNRTVALKFLPSQVSGSEQDKARFLQEAQAAAGLNHPNICTIHGIEEYDQPDKAGLAGNQQFIVMEFVDGQMLQEKKSSLSMKQALEIGIQIAEGLAAAHEKGIVHRDIKPENIMIRKDGIAQVMDFGLAKLRGATRLTKEGSTVGTAGYMSPEQVQGQETDHRADIFSLGVLLYEMLTGQLPFKGVHETAIAYEIVNVDSPPMSSLRPEIPPELDAIVLECLEKDPNDRTQSAKQVAVDLKRYKRESNKTRVSRMISTRSAMSPQRISLSEDLSVSSSRIRQLLPWSLTVVALVVTIAVVAMSYFSRSSSLSTIQALIPSPKGTNFHSYGTWAGPVIVSPDGRMLAFVSATPEGKTLLYLRHLDAGDAVLLPGTEGAYYPFWSYDSRWIGFFSTATGKLKKVDVAGNPPITICDAPNQRGGTWSKNDFILFANTTGPLFGVPASGGTPAQVTQMDTSRKESSQRWACFLPDGKHFLYFSRTISLGAEAEGDAIMAGSLDGGPSTFVVNSSTNAVYASGHLLYMRGGTLFAQRFDESTLSVFGDAISIAEGVINDAGFSLGVFSASQNGVLAFQTGVGIAGARMVIVDRQGKVLEHVGDIIEHFTIRISPDGKQIVQSIFDPKSRTQNLWMHDLIRGSLTRFTSGIDAGMFPVWSPDGRKIAYTRFGGGDETHANSFSILVQSVAGGSGDDTLFESENFVSPSDWSPDGSALCVNVSPQFTGFAPQTQSDIWIQSLGGDKKMRVFVQSPYNETDGRFSPDGRWIAYTSDETGKKEIYLRPYPGPGTAIKVSTSGGSNLVWRRDGRELFYISNDNKMIGAEIRLVGSSVEIAAMRELFARTPVMDDYDVFPDGKRFLINRTIEPSETDPVTIVVNWTEKVKK